MAASAILSHEISDTQPSEKVSGFRTWIGFSGSAGTLVGNHPENKRQSPINRTNCPVQPNIGDVLEPPKERAKGGWKLQFP